MEQTFFFKNLSKKEEELFSDYINKKLPKIAGLLQRFSRDSHTLKVTVEKFEKHSAYGVELYLNLPTKPLVSKEASHTINKAIDLSVDRLLAQLKKHLAQLRKDREHQSIRRPEANVSKLDEMMEEVM